MRLSRDQQRLISEAVHDVFGRESEVRLFGSRVDDAARGGDIDLHIETEGSPDALVDKELALRARLARALGDRRIDIVVHSRSDPPRSIDRHAHATGVRL